MIPNNTWVFDGKISRVPTYGLVKPTYHTENPYALVPGPAELVQAPMIQAEAYWLFEYIGTDVHIAKYENGEFVSRGVLFNTPTMDVMSASFDQLGRPIVFFDSGPQLLLWWFDPIVEDTVISQFADGLSPYATFDMRYDAPNANSDVLVFYIRDGAIYYRQQRDRYEVEYETPVTSDLNAKKILLAEVADDYRLQLVYDGEQATPPLPPVGDPLLDLSTSEVMFPSTVEAHDKWASAEDAYLAWAAELGLSPTGTDPGLPGAPDDSQSTLPLQFAPGKTGSSTDVTFSSEGGICVYKDLAPVGQTQLGLRNTGNVDINRFYRAGGAPSLIFTSKIPLVDAKYVTGVTRYRANATHAIFYVEYQAYSGTTHHTTMALRLGVGGEMEWVCGKVGDNTIGWAQIFAFVEGTNDTTIPPNPPGTSRSYEMPLGTVRCLTNLS